MVTYVDEVTLTGGTTKDTFGTAITLNLNSKARWLVGLITSGCDTTITTAEGGATQLQVNSSSLGIASQIFLVGSYITSGPATNSSGQGGVAEILPWSWQCGGNEAIAYSAAPTATKTVAQSIMVSTMYCDVLPPTDWQGQFPLIVAVKGGFVVDASQTTTTRTALSAITVPTWARELVGVKAVTEKYGAITTGQSEQIVYEVTSTVPDITPMKIPSNSEGATQGTPVGTGQYNDRIDPIPVYYALPGGTQAITPYVNMVGAVTTSNSVEFGTYWR